MYTPSTYIAFQGTHYSRHMPLLCLSNPHPHTLPSRQSPICTESSPTRAASSPPLTLPLRPPDTRRQCHYNAGRRPRLHPYGPRRKIHLSAQTDDRLVPRYYCGYCLPAGDGIYFSVSHLCLLPSVVENMLQSQSRIKGPHKNRLNTPRRREISPKAVRRVGCVSWTKKRPSHVLPKGPSM